GSAACRSNIRLSKQYAPRLPRVSRCVICERMTTKCSSTGHLHVTRSSVSAVSISSTASAQPERPGFGPPMDPLPLSVNSMPLEAVNVHGNRALRSSSRSISTTSVRRLTSSSRALSDIGWWRTSRSLLSKSSIIAVLLLVVGPLTTSHVDLLPGHGAELRVTADEAIDPDALVAFELRIPLIAPVSAHPVLTQFPSGRRVEFVASVLRIVEREHSNRTGRGLALALAVLTLFLALDGDRLIFRRR